MAESTDDVALIVETLGPGVAGFIVPLRHLDAFHTAVAKSEGAERRPILLVLVNADGWREEANRERIVSALREQRAAGVVIDAVTCDRGECVLGTPALSASIETIRTVRDHIGPDALLIGGVGVHSPADALDVLDAGADLVRVDSGLGFAGPGLPKRINEAILYRELARQVADRTPPTRMASQSWFWAFLMGLSMFLGGLLSLFVATTRVLLPYDEALCGLTRDQVASINDRLLAFMTHDRVTLWGTMLADGILYMALAWWGIRRGLHWAQLAVIVSAFTGFISFFWFLGFGYFDPFHAFVTAILFQFLIMTLHADLPARRAMESPDLWNDGRFKANQWGQLAFVIHGAVLIVAGIVISVVGMTSVFVHEDLEFMRTTADALVSAHPGLLPLVAHDRATFGGMLLSCGAVTLLSALWGFCHGQRWLWWALMIAGTIAYGATLAVHHHVGYDSLLHLAPAYGGLTLLWIGGAASYRYLVASDPRLTPEWRRRLAATL